jgi:hypothetical protein
MVRLGILALILGLVGIPDRTDAPAAAQAPALVVVLASDRPAYTVGTMATFTLAVDNPSDTSVMLTFPSEQRYDVVAFVGEVEVWRWSAGRDFADAESERSFPPGVTLLGRVTWDWRDASGAPLPPGTYRLVARLTAAPPQAGNVLEIPLEPVVGGPGRAPWSRGAGEHRG